MTSPDALTALSDAIETHVSEAAGTVAAVECCGQQKLSGVLWRLGVVVTSEQSLPQARAYGLVLPGGAQVAATLAGRDPTTNVAVLRFEGDAPTHSVAEPKAVGGMVLALGSDGRGGASARLGTVELLGPAWDSQMGGRIDRLIRIGVQLGRTAEGGPVVDAAGAMLGMSTFGPRRSVLVIPGSTVARVVQPLLDQGRVERGWLGVGVHPVALPKELGARAETGSGLMVVSIAEGSPASASLLPGDILLEIAGAAVTSPRGIAAALGPETIGKSVAVKLLRGGTVIAPEVTITARPPHGRT